MDVILAFPQIMLALVAVTTLGVTSWLIVLAVGLTTMPRVARVSRGAAQPVVERDFVAAAEALGVARWRILLGEILPNILSPLMVEASLRLTYSIALIAALAFLGFSTDPNGANWGTMIQENQPRARLAAVGRRAARRRDHDAHDRHEPGRRRPRARGHRHRPRQGRRVSAGEPAVAVEGLRIVLRDTEIDIVDEVSFTIAPGEVLGLVGESGSGKTTVGLALLGHTRRGAAIAAGSIRVGDVDILDALEQPRGARCAAASSRTCRRTRPPPSTRPCASARSCARRSRCTASARARTSARRASPRSCARSRCPTTRSTCGAIRTSSPAGSSSASASPWRSRAARA